MTPHHPATSDGARALLREVWGYDGFRPGQEETIAAVLAGRDALAILPTGGGKSLLYQIPALLLGGLTVVVSPLIALMHDQVAALRRRGIAAVAVNSTMGARQVEQAFTDARYGKYQLLYLAPERFGSDAFAAIAPHLPVRLLAVDEAHCVSEWAPHFRPAYRGIAAAREALGRPPLLAVTATATPEVRADIEGLLGLESPFRLVQGFGRPNLALSVRREDNKRARLRALLDYVEGAGVVYASTRRDVEAWAAWLQRENVSAVAYHGGMPAAERAAAQEAWLRGRARVMVATNAFGMGIDRADVRFVVHVAVPASIEAYYQEAGRAGRDGRPAHALLLWQPRDLETEKALIEQSHPTPAQLAAVFDALGNLGQVALGAVPLAPLRLDREKVAALAGVAPALLESALDVLERAGVVQRADVAGDGFFAWNAGREKIVARAGQQGALARFVEGLLRMLPAEAFGQPVPLFLRPLAARLKMDANRLARGLHFLAEQGLARWQPHADALVVSLLVPRTRRLVVQDVWLEKARAAAQRRLAHVEALLASPICRQRFVLGYFGEKAPERCGRCDRCRDAARAPGPAAADADALRTLLETLGRGEVPPQNTNAALVDWLLAEGYARRDAALETRYTLTPQGQGYLARLSAAGRAV